MGNRKGLGLVDPNKSLIKQLGPESAVTLESENLPVDREANEVIHRIGKAQAEPGMNYCGTISIRLYLEGSAMTKETYRIANITDIAMKMDLSEALVATAMNNATIAIRTHFNPAYKFKTNRKGDKRGSVK